MWTKIVQELTDQHGYMSGVDRMTDRIKETGEVFTPTLLVIEMMQQLLEADPSVFDLGKTVLDPACGDGQFLVAIKHYKTLMNPNIPEETINADLYGVDIMRDNVDLCKKRLNGGTILMGDTLNPTAQLQDQTGAEHEKMVELFSDVQTLGDFFS